MSATPVREAMLELAADGLVEAVPNKGYRVVELSQHDLDEIFEVRLMLEVPAAEGAASGWAAAGQMPGSGLWPTTSSGSPRTATWPASWRPTGNSTWA